MSKEVEQKLLSFLNDTYENGNWDNLIAFIDENFISKEDIKKTEN